MAQATQMSPTIHTASRRGLSTSIQALGTHLVHYGLVLVLAWIGAMKFTAYEANGIQPLVANSPMMSWVYQLLSIQAFSNGLGVMLIAMGRDDWLATRVGVGGSNW